MQITKLNNHNEILGVTTTFYGHSCFGMEIDGINLLFDPFITPNPLAKEIKIDNIKADYILITHGHEDHVADAVTIAQQTGAKIISNFEIVNWFQTKGIDNGHPMNLGGSWNFEFGTVKCVNAVHSSVMPDGVYGGNPMGFVIETNSFCFYHAGDTALTYDMKIIGENHELDFAFLPLGDNFTMGPSDALLASDYIGCDNIIGMHYDTFDYIKINHQITLESFKKQGKTLTLPVVGNGFNPLI